MGRCKCVGSLNHSLYTHLSYLGPVSCVFTSWVSSGLTRGSGCSLMAAKWQVFFPSWVSSGFTGSHWKAAIADDCDIPITDMAGNISFLNSHSQTKQRSQKKPTLGLPWWSSGWHSTLPMQLAWVWPLVRELCSPMAHSTTTTTTKFFVKNKKKPQSYWHLDLRLPASRRLRK